MAHKKGVDTIDQRGQQRLLRFIRQRRRLLYQRAAAEIAQRQGQRAVMQAHREIVPGERVEDQADGRSAARARLLKFRLLHQMSVEHFTHDLGDAGGRQLRQSGKFDTRNRTVEIDQAVNNACISLFDLVNMARLTIQLHALCSRLFSRF